MKQKYHPYNLWEDWKAGMYALKDPDISKVDSAKELLSNPKQLKSCMYHVAFNWTHSAEVNLSNTSRNRQAWLGQAACCYYCNSPEFITKQAWHILTDNQRIEANNVADEIILEWEQTYLSKNQCTLFEFSEVNVEEILI